MDINSLLPLVLTSSVSAIVGAIVASIVALIKAQSQGAIDTNKALQQGMRQLLWGELKREYKDAVDNNGMTVTDRRHLESVYSAYHTLGGNGTGTRLYNDAMSLPVLSNTELE